ncbi:thioredoxin fold domain-containing protein [Ideonella sp.]|uniref:thioredoxin fold domain-containing protein n=1 Tax=Ideonella sp. TaxID=1929293 RepID=UPI002B4A9DA0|nr:thioredoxin fold domain-containing protein [Ideonella sp.]HJV69405.1 thioredoxin fold domain-containing protein [Ideonella sp.]
MQRRFFALSSLATLATLTVLAGCGRKAETSPAAPPAPAASGTAGAASEAPVTPAAQDAYTLAATGSGFTTGPIMSAHTVYVFFDTTCPHCAHLWQNTQPLGNQLKIVWMPIGLLRPQSLPQGATILGAKDPAAAMAENEASVANHGGGITAAASLDDAVVAKVRANTELFQKFNADSVPLIVFRNAKTGEVGQHAGAVDAAQLLALAGL